MLTEDCILPVNFSSAAFALAEQSAWVVLPAFAVAALQAQSAVAPFEAAVVVPASGDPRYSDDFPSRVLLPQDEMLFPFRSLSPLAHTFLVSHLGWARIREASLAGTPSVSVA